jgi:hypothetical protein
MFPCNFFKYFDYFKGLSHEMDLAFEDIWSVLNFYVLQRFYNAKRVYLAVNASSRWLNNVRGVYLVQVSLLLIGQQGLGDFFRYRPLLSIGYRIVQILRQRRRKTTNTAPTTLSAIQASSQSNFIYTSLVISRNNKNKQLKLLSQRKLALTVKNIIFAL